MESFLLGLLGSVVGTLLTFALGTAVIKRVISKSPMGAMMAPMKFATGGNAPTNKPSGFKKYSGESVPDDWTSDGV